MIQAFVITLREGVEACLVVGIALAFLRKAGRTDLFRTVGAGVTAAVAVSVALAAAIQATDFDPEGRAEGIVLLASAGLVVWLLVWMWRHGRRLKEHTEERLGALLGGSKAGIFLFTFFMVLREGVETILLLLAAQFSTESLLSVAGALGGLAVAVALAVAFFRGTYRADLRRFFGVTTAILALFAFQLVAAGIHEFAESGDLPSGETYMRAVGPLMKHGALFVIAVLALPFALVLRRPAEAGAAAAWANPAEERKERARARAERAARLSFATLALLSVAALGWAYADQSRSLELSPVEEIFPAAAEISVPVARVSDGRLHRFGVPHGEKLLRFLVLRTGQDPETYGTAMDACTICNDWGYVQVLDRLVCRNCVAEINAPTVGQGGGCNPVPVRHERRGDALVLRLDALTAHEALFKTGQRLTAVCPVCRMKFDLAEAGGRHEGRPYCRMPECERALRGGGEGR